MDYLSPLYSFTLIRITWRTIPKLPKLINLLLSCQANQILLSVFRKELKSMFDRLSDEKCLERCFMVVYIKKLCLKTFFFFLVKILEIDILWQNRVRSCYCSRNHSIEHETCLTKLVLKTVSQTKFVFTS